MVREDHDADWSHFLDLASSAFGYTSTIRFGDVGFAGFTTGDYNAAFREQRTAPVWLGVEGDEAWWWYRDRIWRAERGLAPEGLVALVAAQGLRPPTPVSASPTRSGPPALGSSGGVA